MSDVQAKLGHVLLQRLTDLRTQKGNIGLEDIGDMFLHMASSLNPNVSPADQFMHEEIRRLAAYITNAKQEIFAISTNEQSEQAISNASMHLDAVIKSTEEATHIIMDAADTIQTNTGGIGGEKEQAIMDATMRIYEACNFQDITGQRITKVIKLLSNIEERITKLNALFGTNDNGAVEPASSSGIVLPINEKDLLNGPQLPANMASQDDIDALFASLGGKN